MGKKTFPKLVERRIGLNVAKIPKEGTQGANIGRTRGKVMKSTTRATRGRFD